MASNVRILDTGGAARLDDFLGKAIPIARFQLLAVTFPTTPNLDLDIKHDLCPLNPEDVDYEVLRSTAPTTIYHDQSGTRKPWGTGYVILRSTRAEVIVTLRLSLRA